jgi:hypothetical protein
MISYTSRSMGQAATASGFRVLMTATTSAAPLVLTLGLLLNLLILGGGLRPATSG